MAFLHMWRKERQGKVEKWALMQKPASTKVYMVEHWERHLSGGGQESRILTPVVEP